MPRDLEREIADAERMVAWAWDAFAECCLTHRDEDCSPCLTNLRAAVAAAVIDLPPVEESS